MHEFCSIYNLHNLCGNVTLYENLENHDASFQNTQTKESGLPSFYGSVARVCLST